MEVFRPGSSHIAELRYDEAARVLEVVFAARARAQPVEFYRYQNVEATAWHALKTAKSVGNVFTILIRNNPVHYPFTKHLVNEPVPSKEADTLEDVLKKSVKPLTARRPRINITKKD